MEVLFDGRVNLRQSESAKIRREAEKALLAVSGDWLICQYVNGQGRRHRDEDINQNIVKENPINM